jgi:heptosyltransferase-1
VNREAFGVHPKILIIKLSSLGDVIHALPVVAALKERFPLSSISFLVNREYGELLNGHASIDEVLLFERNLGNRFFNRIKLNWKLIRRIREKQFDLVIDLQGLFRSGLISWLSGGKRRVGLGDSREGSRYFYQEVISIPKEVRHAVDRYLLIPKAFGWQGKAEFLIPIGEKDKVFVEQFMKAEKVKAYLPIVAIHATARWRTKRWSARNFRLLGDLLQRSKGCQVAFLGSKEEIQEIREMTDEMESPPILATGKFSLKQLTAFLNRCAVLVTNDSGPMHLAAALNVPVIALFGASDFQKTGPYGRSEQVLFKDVACRPCLKRICGNQEFPMECLETISPEEVFEAVKVRMNPA